MKIGLSNTGKVEYDRKVKNDLKTKYKDDTEVTKKNNGDILDISNESKKLSLISSRLHSGYYNSNELLDEVTERINQEI